MEMLKRMWGRNEKPNKNAKEDTSNNDQKDSEWFLYPKSLVFFGAEWITIDSNPKLDLTNQMTMMGKYCIMIY